MNKTQDDFIKNTKDKNSLSLLNRYNQQLDKFQWMHGWPIIKPDEIMSKEGSELKKTFLLYLSEKEWNTLDRHIKNIGNISKQAWMKNAILTMLSLEQQKFIDEMK